MKLACALGASLILFSAAPAAAQVYPGEDVTVNPGALGHGYLLYPGGRYGRHVGNLLQPGERGGPIHLHMPVHHRVARLPRVPRVAAATPPDAIPSYTPLTPPAETLPPSPPPRHPAHRAPPRQTAAATPPPPAPPPAQPQTADPNAMPEDSAARLFAPDGGAPPPAKPVKPVKPATRTAHAPPPSADDSAAIPFSLGGDVPPPPARRTASATPPRANTTPPAGVAAGLRKQSVIPFAEGASSPASADVNAIHALAAQLNAALTAGAARVQLEAYGGPRGDKSSDSRRLSLKRALVVRELLIEDGVPSEKIDVRAMGGVDDSGAADRVDVFVRA